MALCKGRVVIGSVVVFSATTINVIAVVAAGLTGTLRVIGHLRFIRNINYNFSHMKIYLGIHIYFFTKFYTKNNHRVQESVRFKIILV